jgi:hypothetical protein
MPWGCGALRKNRAYPGSPSSIGASMALLSGHLCAATRVPGLGAGMLDGACMLRGKAPRVPEGGDHPHRFVVVSMGNPILRERCVRDLPFCPGMWTGREFPLSVIGAWKEGT